MQLVCQQRSWRLEYLHPKERVRNKVRFAVKVLGPTAKHISCAHSPGHNTYGDTGPGNRTEGNEESPLPHESKKVWALLLKTAKIRTLTKSHFSLR